MSVPETPWLRRLPRRPAAAPEPLAAPAPHLDLVHPPRSRPAAPPAAAPASGGLTVLQPAASDASPGAPRRGAALLLVPPPPVVGVVTLDRQEPVVRMDALQSGIGGLIVRDAAQVAWEDDAGRSGVVEPGGASSGDDVPRYGNRSLVRPFEHTVLLTLRHVRRLRRLLIDAPANTAVTVTPHLDGVVRAADPSARLRLSIVVVAGRLEIRAEYGLPDDWPAALGAMGWSPLALLPRTAPDSWQ